MYGTQKTITIWSSRPAHVRTGEWERGRGLHRFRFCVGRRQPVADGPTGGSVVGLRRRPRAPPLPTYAYPAAFTITPSGRRRRRLLYNTVPPPPLSTRYPFGVGLITGSSTSRIVWFARRLVIYENRRHPTRQGGWTTRTVVRRRGLSSVTGTVPIPGPNASTDRCFSASRQVLRAFIVVILDIAAARHVYVSTAVHTVPRVSRPAMIAC